MKKVISSLLALVLSMTLAVSPSMISASSQERVSLTPNSFASRSVFDGFVKNQKNVNIILYKDEEKTVEEFHSNGHRVTSKFDKEGLLSSVETNEGYTEKYDWNTKKITISYDGKEFTQSISESSNKGSYSIVDSTPMATLDTYEDYYVYGYLGTEKVNSLITDVQYNNSNSMNQNDIQTLLINKNSILKDIILIYRQDYAGGPIYATGNTCNPSYHINYVAKLYGINPKLILVTLQKEQQLIINSTSKPQNSSSLLWAMGYAKTDTGSDYSKTGFETQVYYGTSLLRSRYDESPSSSYPRKLPDGIITSINYGQNYTIAGNVYKNYIWVDNRATYTLYRYTPHAFDYKVYQNEGLISGGNYVFVKVFKSLFTSWN